MKFLVEPMQEMAAFEEAKALLSYDNDRRILAMAHERITGEKADPDPA